MQKTLLLLLILMMPSLTRANIPVDLWQLTLLAAREHHLEPELLAALIWAESRYQTAALGPENWTGERAVGLGQLLPSTAKGLGVDPFDPTQNVFGAAAYLRQQWDTFQDWPSALAAYNAGPGRVREYGGVPPFRETQLYVRNILITYHHLKQQQPTPPPRVHRRKR